MPSDLSLPVFLPYILENFKLSRSRQSSVINLLYALLSLNYCQSWPDLFLSVTLSFFPPTVT